MLQCLQVTLFLRIEKARRRVLTGDEGVVVGGDIFSVLDVLLVEADRCLCSSWRRVSSITSSSDTLAPGNDGWTPSSRSSTNFDNVMLLACGIWLRGI